MVNTTLIFSLLLSISALTTSFAALAENSDCPPGTDANSLCQQFQVTGVVPAVLTVTGQDKIYFERVDNKIKGTTDVFTVETTASNITLSFPLFSSSKQMGLFHSTTEIPQNCAVTTTSSISFPLVVKLSVNGGNYQEVSTKSKKIELIDNTNQATFQLTFESIDDFGGKLDTLLEGEYRCDWSITVKTNT